MFSTEEEYKRLSEALADEGSYNAVAFKYSADYYDPSQPTEEEDPNKETGEKSLTGLGTLNSYALYERPNQGSKPHDSTFNGKANTARDRKLQSGTL